MFEMQPDRGRRGKSTVDRLSMHESGTFKAPGKCRAIPCKIRAESDALLMMRLAGVWISRWFHCANVVEKAPETGLNAGAPTVGKRALS
jgi:hypothetical protein